MCAHRNEVVSAKRKDQTSFFLNLSDQSVFVLIKNWNKTSFLNMAGTDRNVCITVMCWAKFSVSKLHFVHHLRTYVHKSETLDANRVEKAIQTWWLVYFEYHNTEWSQSQAKIMAVLWCLQNVKKNSCTKITFLLKIYWITGQPRPSNLWDEQQAGNRHTSLLFQAVSFSVWYWYIIFFFWGGALCCTGYKRCILFLNSGLSWPKHPTWNESCICVLQK